MNPPTDIRLVDWLAALAMQGQCANPDYENHSYESTSARAYIQAEAQIAEMEKNRRVSDSVRQEPLI